jgi:DICT domain-containing protein/predicted DNA-binding transcriptional regulator AlpA
VSDANAPALSMREMSSRSGVSEGTLRMWEARHGFPAPERLPSGHRRYSELDLRRIRAVLRDREQGLSLATAIDRALRLSDEPRPSVYSGLRASFPHLQRHLLPKPALVCLSHAIEDEVCSRGERPILFGCFQHERFYRQAEPRWREMARTAERAVVLADFRRTRRPKGAPAEVAIGSSDALMREWVVVCEAPGFAACLVGFERPGQPRDSRSFETIWSAERPVVREAARTCCELIARAAPELADEMRARLAQPLPPQAEELRTVVDLTTRMVLYGVSA